MSSSSTSTSPLISTSIESAAATKSLPTFDRFKRLKNLRDDPAHLQRLVTPRFCSPDRCSGEQPRCEKFALVDQVVGDLFRIKMEMVAMSRAAVERGKMRLAVINALLPQLASLGTTTLSEQQEVTELVSIACQEYAHHHRSSVLYSQFKLNSEAMFYLDTEIVFGQLLERFHHLDGSTLDRDAFPCFCFLSRHPDELLEIQEFTRSVRNNIVDDIRRRVVLPATDTADVERRLKSGSLTLGGSLREDRRLLLGRLIEFVDEAMAEFIVTQHRHFYPDGFCQLSTLFSSAQIMEELSAFSFDRSEDRWVAPTALVSLFLVTSPTFAVSSKSAKGLGDRAEGRIRLEKEAWIVSVDTYRLASMIDPSNFGARLNSAAVRLRLVDDDSQAFHWSRIIYDCSAAIYYGSTSFKAFYRRGVALTHLKLWDKAISDFEQALLIDPGNVLVELCLAAAKRKAVL